MKERGFINLLPEDRQVRKMTDKPRGRGIDGIYKNSEPLPPYVVTETKYRTEAGKYIDGDGIMKDTVQRKAAKAKSAKQMSDRWILDRLDDEVPSKIRRDIEDEGYQRWLMIGDSSGGVERRSIG